jgi:plastocyanin
MFMSMSRHRLGALGLAALGLLAASYPALTAPSDTAQISIKDFMFAPNSLTIKAGSTVRWANQDNEPHTVVSDTGLFKSGAMDTGENFTYTFDKPGTYHFICSIHPQMVGTIVVEAAPRPSAP